MTTPADQNSAEGPGFVGIRFCQECNNMLYPKEDKVKTDKLSTASVSILSTATVLILSTDTVTVSVLFFLPGTGVN